MTRIAIHIECEEDILMKALRRLSFGELEASGSFTVDERLVYWSKRYLP